MDRLVLGKTRRSTLAELDMTFQRIFTGVFALLVLPACSSDSKSAAPGASTTGHDAGAEAGPSSGHDAGGTCSGKTGVSGENNITVIEADAPDGGARGAIVHVPQSYDASKPTMLVLNLHGLLEGNVLQE